MFFRALLLVGVFSLSLASYGKTSSVEKVMKQLDRCTRSCSESCIEKAENLLESAQYVLDECGSGDPTANCIATIAEFGFTSDHSIEKLCKYADSDRAKCIRAAHEAGNTSMHSLVKICVN